MEPPREQGACHLPYEMPVPRCLAPFSLSGGGGTTWVTPGSLLSHHEVEVLHSKWFAPKIHLPISNHELIVIPYMRIRIHYRNCPLLRSRVPSYIWKVI